MKSKSLIRPMSTIDKLKKEKEKLQKEIE